MFLDVAANRYFCLPFASEAAFLRMAAGESEETGRLEGLLARGLLVDAPDASALSRPVDLAPPDRDLLQPSVPEAGIGDVLAALAAEVRAAWQLKRRSFLHLVQRLDERQHPPGQADAGPYADAGAIGIAAGAERLCVVRRKADRCLVRALAVQDRCRRLGIRSRVAFGVRVNPFGAHCWVQLEGKVLVGDFEQVRLFTPILAVG